MVETVERVQGMGAFTFDVNHRNGDTVCLRAPHPYVHSSFTRTRTELAPSQRALYRASLHVPGVPMPLDHSPG